MELNNMSMDYCANYVDEIKSVYLKKLCPVEFKELTEVLKGLKLDIDDISRDISFSNYDDIDTDIITAYQKLQAAFEKLTGLSVELGYHSSEDDGSGYDDVDGTFWSVEGMMQLSPAGENLKTMVERKSFVTCC